MRAPLETIRAWVGGKTVPSSTGELFSTFDPAIGARLADVEVSGPTEVDRAVESARRGVEAWSKTPGAERARVLRRAAGLLRERVDRLATLEVRDTGKPIAEAKTVDVPSAAEVLEYFASIAQTLTGEHIDLGTAFVYTRREPLGVCAGIGAWNYPLQIAAWKSAPALAGGNAMVFKPSELTPVTAIELARIYSEAGLPDGVFNVVQGAAETGRALAVHPRIAKISLTGEVGTGRLVMADAARTLKHVTMELGGKSPLVLFADCRLDQAVKAAMLANFFTQGEVCSNGTRVFVERPILDAFLNDLVPRVGRMRIGDPLDPATEVGALISEQHLDRVLGYVQAGRREGAKLVIGGERPRFGGERAALDGGWFVSPAVFAACSDRMSIVREEIFGPVMCVLPFDGEEEVIARANDTEFGLAAGVFTRDLAKAHRVIARLEAGTCWINNYNVTPVEMPFGGVKQSGIGRENGLAAIEHYTSRKSVYVELGDVVSPYA
jgi:betaine-aldehyde dehydrogenase